MTSWIKTGGGQLSSPLTFSNIIMAILWGNTLITFENDIIDTNGETTEEFILKKESNWISEFSIVEEAFPKNWIQILKTESSAKKYCEYNPKRLFHLDTSVY